jgi:molecular chaperone GrpE
MTRHQKDADGQQPEMTAESDGQGSADPSGGIIECASPPCSVEMPPDAGEAEQDAGAGAIMRELESVKGQLEEFRERALRAQAETENLRKRAERDVENAHRYALDRFIGELLPVLDSMELGVAAGADASDIDSLRQGMDLTLKKFQDAIAKFGVTVLDPQGQRFDPEKHEAVAVQDAQDTGSGMVIAVMQKGYELNGRLVRPAMVVVSR